jgi:hypothetical protein
MYITHLMSWFNPRFFYAPADDLGTIGDVNDVGEDKENGNSDDAGDVDDNKEDDDNPPEDEGDDKEDENDEDNEEEDDKEKEDDEEEDDDEKETSLRVTSYTDIKKKYPEFFKQFPDVRNSLFRESRYTEILGSVEDAEAAAQKANVLDKLQEDLIGNGDPVELLKTIKKESPESYEKTVAGVFSYLQEHDKQLYIEVAAVPIKQLLRAAWKEGKGKDTDLGRAAAYIHQYFFNDTDIDKAVKGETKASKEQSPREKELEERLRKVEESKYTEFQSSVDNSYINSMSKVIMEGLDKDDRLNTYTKNKLVEDVLRDIKSQLDKDPRYQASQSALWKQARANGFANDFKSRITNAALARAKSLVPTTRQKLVSEIFKKAKVNTKANNNSEDKKPQSQHREPRRDSNRKTNEPAKPRTDLDILRS